MSFFWPRRIVLPREGCLSPPKYFGLSFQYVAAWRVAKRLRRAIFFHRQGEIRDRTFENQSFRASGSSLITAAIVHWNTVYLERAVQHLRTQGAGVPDDLLPHVAPLGWEHIALTGDCVWANTDPASNFRPLNDVRSMFMHRAAYYHILASQNRCLNRTLPYFERKVLNWFSFISDYVPTYSA
jgi:hypothetical protein